MSRDYSYLLHVAAAKYPDRTVLAYKDQRWTFRDFDIATDRLSAAFERLGLTGRNVVTLLENEPATVMTYLALARAGAINVPVNPRLLSEEVGFVLQDCGASAIIADDAFSATVAELLAKHDGVDRLVTVNAPRCEPPGERLEDLLEGPDHRPGTVVDPASVASIIYTSGTSGFPKGVERSHEANIWAAVNAALAQHRSPSDTEVFVLPLFGIAFMFQVMPMILSGGTTVLDGAFDAERIWELIESHRATRIFLAPTMLDSMLSVAGQEQRDVSSLRILNTAYEFPERVRKGALERFGAIVAYMYGLTEAQLCVSTPEEFAEDPSNAGHPMGVMRVGVFGADRNPVPVGTVGEIAFEGPSIMAGYHGLPEVTSEALIDGWLYTGDLGHIDACGRIHVVGRKKAMIKTGGLSVDPIEVENVIAEIAAIREAAVVGILDEHWGEQVVAFAVLAEGAEGSEAEILAYTKSRLAGYKCPKRVWFLPALPRNPTGKVERGRLEAEAAGRAGI